MYCGIHCLTFVAKQNDVKLSYRRALKLAKPTRNGTRAESMISTLKEIGFRRAYLRTNLKWSTMYNHLKRGNTVIVAWWSDLDAGNKRPVPMMPDGHWCVVLKMDKETITLYDPDAPQERHLPKLFFVSRWWDYDIVDTKGTRRDLIHAAIIVKK